MGGGPRGLGAHLGKVKVNLGFCNLKPGPTVGWEKPQRNGGSGTIVPRPQ